MFILGVTDSKNDGTFLWSFSGNNFLTSLGVPWCTLEPQGGTSENCVALIWPTWCYIDITCSQSLYHICQKDL